MEKIKIFMNLISDSRIRLSDLGGHTCGKFLQECFIKIHTKKTKKVPRSFNIKSSRYFNIIKKRVLLIKKVPS